MSVEVGRVTVGDAERVFYVDPKAIIGHAVAMFAMRGTEMRLSAAVSSNSDASLAMNWGMAKALELWSPADGWSGHLVTMCSIHTGKMQFNREGT